MKILINASNINKGGALQVAHSFLSEIKNNAEHLFYVILSPILSEQISVKEYPENFVFYIYSLPKGIFKAIAGKDSYLRKIEHQTKPDVVFTIFGPAYWNPRSKHVVGFADGWCYNPDSIAFHKISVLQKIKIQCLIKLKNFRIKREADIIIVETEDAKQKISKHLKINKEVIKVVGNTFHDIFNSKDFPVFYMGPRKENEFRLITISANYPHKNLDIIKKVIPFLENKKINANFWLTIKQEEYEQLFKGYEKWVKNIGPIDIKFVPSIYQQCDALFLPTLLETFTASYPEAMKMGKPILTSDLSFAHDICGDAAEYFDPLNSEDIANKIENIIINDKRRIKLINEGYSQLIKFEVPSIRAKKYLEICKQNLL